MASVTSSGRTSASDLPCCDVAEPAAFSASRMCVSLAYSSRFAAMEIILHQVLLVQFTIIFVSVQTLSLSSQPTPGVKYKSCVSSEVECWQQGKIPNIDSVCFEPLDTSPCMEGHWFILDEKNDHLQGHCELQLCAKGMFPFEGRCVEEADARVAKCAGGPVFVNATGQLECGEPAPLQALVLCVPTTTSPMHPARPTVVWTGNVQCPMDNNGRCTSEVVTDNQGVTSLGPPQSKICNQTDFDCWQRKLLPFNGSCYQPLQNSPCSEGYWFVLDSNSIALRGFCAPRSCKETEILYHNNCFKPGEASSILCKGKFVDVDFAGQPYCRESPTTELSLHDVVRCDQEEAIESPELKNNIAKRNVNLRDGQTYDVVAKVTFTNSLACPTNNDGNCVLQVVEQTTHGAIILDAEE